MHFPALISRREGIRHASIVDLSKGATTPPISPEASEQIDEMKDKAGL